MIGDDVEVTVLSVSGEKVRLGIQAPPSIPVHRTEIYREIQQGDDRRSERGSAESTRLGPGSRRSPRSDPDESGS